MKTGAARRLAKAERVRCLEGYPWSSYPGYVSARQAADFVCYDLLADYGPTAAAARRHYRAYTHAFILEEDGPLLEAIEASRYAIGSPAFRERIERQLEDRRSGRPQDADLALPRATVPIERIDQLVTAHYALDPAALRGHGNRTGEAKRVALDLACRLTGWTQRAIGEYYGGISSAAVGAARQGPRGGRSSGQDNRAPAWQSHREAAR